ncbi:MAG: deoxyribose-phosphate aldolase [Planctomycetia bacterium]
MSDLAAAAARILPLVDLTSLREEDREDDITALCAKALTRRGCVAAVCVLPRLVPAARRALAGTPVRVATVANFPAGDDDPQRAAAEVEAAVAGGADEVDVVFPWRAFLAGQAGHGRRLVAACRAAAGARLLKVILETGAFPGGAQVTAAAHEAVEGGADFLKTSTGKREPGATPEAVAALLGVIAATRGARAQRPVGLKVSGGVRTTAQAAACLAQADAALGPAWASPRTLRFGASALLDDLLAHLQGRPTP